MFSDIALTGFALYNFFVPFHHNLKNLTMYLCSIFVSSDTAADVDVAFGYFPNSILYFTSRKYCLNNAFFQKHCFSCCENVPYNI